MSSAKAMKAAKAAGSTMDENPKATRGSKKESNGSANASEVDSMTQELQNRLSVNGVACNGVHPESNPEPGSAKPSQSAGSRNEDAAAVIDQIDSVSEIESSLGAESRITTVKPPEPSGPDPDSSGPDEHGVEYVIYKSEEQVP